MDTQTLLCVAVDSGKCPIGILADWLEDNGDSRAPALRKLIQDGKRPSWTNFGAQTVYGWTVWAESLGGDMASRKPSTITYKEFRILARREPNRETGDTVWFARESEAWMALAALTE